MGLTNSQYAGIMREYDQKQYRHRDLVTQRRDEICQRIPEYESVQEDIARLSIDAARALLENNAAKSKKLRSEAQKLIRKKARLLKKAGLPKDYEEPPFSCPDCRDTGFIGGQKCHCFTRAAVELLYREARLAPDMEQADFSLFSTDYYSPSVTDSRGISAVEYATRALDICRSFAKHFKEPGYTQDQAGLLLYGDVGVGKTFLTACIAKELIRREYFVLYFSAVQFFDTMANGAFKRDGTPIDPLYGYISECDLLIIDDLGTELANNFTASQLFSCINERLLAEKPVIISTNLSLETIKTLYTERTFSRITSCYTLLPMIGEDIRLKKRFEQT